ncbi:DUF397 domain-containing protein [Streptomyces sp. NPDC051162]|uniref:DUF397 domain-containing protein n=1 Tax=Streptomyces sp. NPDC051162 TaxID=3154747 RepID=UPI003422F02C
MKYSNKTALNGLAFKKSSYSGNNTNCVEVATLPDGQATAVRDSKNPDGAVLVFPASRWAAFIAKAIELKA